MNTSIQKILSPLASAGFLAMSVVQSAFAGNPLGNTDIGTLPGEMDEAGLRTTIINLVKLVLDFVALAAVVVVVIAGIRLILSQGSDEQKDKAKKTIFYALIGLIVVLFARVIVGLVTSVLFSQAGGTSN